MTNNTFKRILPNLKVAEQLIQNAAPAVALTVSATITPKMKVVLDYLTEYGKMTNKELQELLNIKKACVYLLSRQMNEPGLIEIEDVG